MSEPGKGVYRKKQKKTEQATLPDKTTLLRFPYLAQRVIELVK